MSKRKSTSIYKAAAPSLLNDSSIDLEVKEVVENLLDQIVEHQQQSKEPPRKIILNNDCKAEKEWKREVGNVLF